MTTWYNTPDGPTQEPISVELIDFGGTPLGHLGSFDEMTFTFAGGEADTAELEIPLTETTAQLLPCDGRVLIAARINGVTHLTTPVQVKATSGINPDTGTLSVTAAGGWTLLDGQVLPPGLYDGLTTTDTAYTITGPLETVVKQLITVGTLRVSHPIYVTPDRRRGPEVTASGAWETVGDAVRDLLAGTGYRLDIQSWVPGDNAVTDAISAAWPFIAVDVVPYRRREGLVWSAEGGDIDSWEATNSRATMTRVVVSNAAQEPQDRYSDVAKQESPGQSWWAIREGYRKIEDPPALGENGTDPFRIRDNLQAQAEAELSRTAAAQTLAVKIAPGTAWRFGTGDDPRTYRVGDIATVDLPLIGRVEQAVTAVEVKITPTEMTVTPTVATPDTTDRSPLGALARLGSRVDTLERS